MRAVRDTEKGEGEKKRNATKQVTHSVSFRFPPVALTKAQSGSGRDVSATAASRDT